MLAHIYIFIQYQTFCTHRYTYTRAYPHTHTRLFIDLQKWVKIKTERTNFNQDFNLHTKIEKNRVREDKVLFFTWWRLRWEGLMKLSTPQFNYFATQILSLRLLNKIIMFMWTVVCPIYINYAVVKGWYNFVLFLWRKYFNNIFSVVKLHHDY